MNAVGPRFSIPNPCQKTWADLRGDGRERYCETCRTSVHAVEQYSQDEWAKLWRESDGHVCGLLCKESPPEPRSRRAVLAGALLTAISPLMAQAGRVRIRVTDPAGTVIPGARVSLLGPDNTPTRTEQTDERGEIVFADLPVGDCRLAVAVIGFSTRRLTVPVRGGDELKVEAVLQVGFVGEVVTVTQDAPLIKKPERPTDGSPISSPIPSALPAGPPVTSGTKPAKRPWWKIFH